MATPRAIFRGGFWVRTASPVATLPFSNGQTLCSAGPGLGCPACAARRLSSPEGTVHVPSAQLSQMHSSGVGAVRCGVPPCGSGVSWAENAAWEHSQSLVSACSLGVGSVRWVPTALILAVPWTQQPDRRAFCYHFLVVRRCLPGIPELWEAEVGGLQV